MLPNLSSYEVKIFLTDYPWEMAITKLPSTMEIGLEIKNKQTKISKSNEVMQNGFSYIPKPRKECIWEHACLNASKSGCIFYKFSWEKYSRIWLNNKMKWIANTQNAINKFWNIRMSEISQM